MHYIDAIKQLQLFDSPVESLLLVTYDRKAPWFTSGINFAYGIICSSGDDYINTLCALQLGTEELDFQRMAWHPGIPYWHIMYNDWYVMSLQELLEWNDWRFHNKNDTSVETWRRYREALSHHNGPFIKG